VVSALEGARTKIEAGFTHSDIPDIVKPRAARNALDCALWDLEAKRTQKPVWQLALLQQPRPMVTAYTLSLDTPEAMAKAAAEVAHRPVLKLKLGREGDVERLRLIRQAAPASRLIIDANEGWTPSTLPELLKVCAEVGVELVEQPLPVTDDEALRHISHDVTICADESAHDRHNLHGLVGKYDAINIKLDKTGGLTEALALAMQPGHEFQDHGGLHAGNLTSDGTRYACRPIGARDRSRWPPASGARPQPRHYIRWQPYVSAAARAVGLGHD
jgi:L-alanine-DL-glutamate epimerase-like enolase superfamily enzyme